MVNQIGTQTATLIRAAATPICSSMMLATTTMAGAGSLTEFSMTEINPPAATGDVAAAAFNPSGQIIGQDMSEDWYGLAARLSQDSLVNLHPGLPFTISSAHAINSAGEVAIVGGLPPNGNGPYTSYVFKYTDQAGLVDLDIQSLGGPFDEFGAQVHELTMNDAGDLAGDWYAGIFGGGDRTFLHTEDGGWVDLGPLLPDNPSGRSHFVDLNEQRQVLFQKNFAGTIYLYSAADGSLTPVDALNAIGADAEDMNDAGQITGHVTIDGNTTAFRYTPGGKVELLDTAGTFGSAFGKTISESGHVVVSADGTFFLWSSDGELHIIDSTELHPDANGGHIAAVSDLGQVAGTIHLPTYEVLSFYWTPQTGMMLVHDLIDPEGTQYTTVNIVDFGGDGSILVNARRQSDDVMTPIILIPDVVEGDLNGDNAVNVADLLILFSAWGECAASGNCPADLNADGIVNGLDLLALLSHWT